MLSNILYRLPETADPDGTNPNVTRCIDNIKDFTSIFLFSLEIQTTIGFGFSRVTEECAPAIVTLTVQVITDRK